MICPVEYWIWLQRTLGPGKSLCDLMSFFGNPEKIYEAGRKNLLNSGIINKKTADALAMFSPSESYTVMKQCENNGWKIITFEDECYPPLLKTIGNYPVVLYVAGDENVLKTNFAIGVVGTRDTSESGERMAKAISADLVNSGAVVVSGGALGIDAAAHEAAIENGGKTVAFLGCGLGCNYLMQNESLRKNISENGALVTENLPFSMPSKSSFPIRNRLISGMSKGVVVVEAGEKSGSVITAEHAKKQGRDVFAVPGDIYNTKYNGTNCLINQGALPVISPSDVSSYYSELTVLNNILQPKHQVSDVAKKITDQYKTVSKQNNAPVKQKQEKPVLPDYATENAKKLYGIITENPKTADEYVDETGLTVQDLLSAITELELYGVIAMQSGKRYGLKIN